MLDALDDIPWNDLEDAFGSAKKIPALVKSLLSKNSERQSHAILSLGEQINHQGSRYLATAPTVPFLLWLARKPSVLNRDMILERLLTIAVGLDGDQLHWQTRMADYVESLERHAAKMTDRQKRELNWGPAIGLDCYFAVRKGVRDFINYLKDRKSAVRIRAAYILAWFPIDSRKSLPRLREKMLSTRRTEELANLILSVGLLEYQASVSRPMRNFVLPYLGDRREIMRYAAALYLYWHGLNEQVIEVLRELSENDNYNCCAPLPFAGYSWTQYAERLLILLEERGCR